MSSLITVKHIATEVLLATKDFEKKKFEKLRKFFLLHLSLQLFERILRVTSTWTIELDVINFVQVLCCRISISLENRANLSRQNF